MHNWVRFPALLFRQLCRLFSTRLICLPLCECQRQGQPYKKYLLKMHCTYLSLIKSLPEQSTPFLSNCLSSLNIVWRCTTTPLPRMFLHLGYRIPQGRRWNAYLVPSTTMVCPALEPPLNLAQTSQSLARMSTSLPLPSSPHCEPRMTQNFELIPVTQFLVVSVL